MAETETPGPSLPRVSAAPPDSSPDSAISQRRNRPWPALPLSALLGVLTLAALLPLLGFGVYSLRMSERADRAAENERLRFLAYDLASAVDRELSWQLATARMLTASRSLQADDIEEFWRHAEDAASQAEGHFILIDRDLQQRVNTRAPFGSDLPRTNGGAPVEEVFASGEPSVGNLAFGAVAQSLLYAVRVPVVIEDEVRYVLSFVPRQSAMQDMLHESYRPSGWRTAILDGNGVILARSNRPEEFYGRTVPPDVWDRVTGGSGIISTVDLEGNPSLTAYHRTHTSDWTVFVWAPEAVLREPAMAGRRLLLYWAAVALAVSLFAAWLSGRLIGSATRLLVAASADLAAARPVAYAPTVMREANTIGASIQQAAQTIGAREADLRRSRNEMRTVMRELTHRSLNLLTVIQLIARQSGRTTQDFGQFMDSFTARIAGLAQSHDLLVSEDWRSVSLDNLVHSQITAFMSRSDPRLHVGGPALDLRPQAVQHLGMALHELATNALKHGALSTASGRLDVHWQFAKDENGEDRLRMTWEETGGPPVERGAHNGFGYAVIETLAPTGLGGTAHLDWRREGLVWTLDVPLSDVAALT
jgi:two-component sensor histidine kinase